MDPLSSPVVEALRLRPVQPAGTGLSSLLRDGQVVAGEVLEIFEGTAFLSLGGSRVAAETDVELEPGQRFFARVEQGEDAVVLRLIGKGADEELPLVTALRSALADHAAPGASLTRLAADLRAVLAQHETADAPASREGARENLTERSTLPAAKLLAHIEGHVGSALTDGRALTTALARSGLFHEALLLRGKVGEQLAREDLKSVLMDSLDELEPGAANESVRRTLGGIDADQLLDVARAQTGDARQIAFALTDGGGFADARLVVDPEGHAREETPDGARSPVASVDVSVDFSTLGPVKAVLRVDGGTLRVRFLVASADVAERLAADQEQLCADLGRDLDAASGRAALLSVSVVDARSIEKSARPSDVRFLGEHLLVDRTA